MTCTRPRQVPASSGPGRTATFALTLPGYDLEQLASQLADWQIAVSAGHLDCPCIMHALQLSGGVLRAGFLHYTTEAEADPLPTALTRATTLARPR